MIELIQNADDQEGLQLVSGLEWRRDIRSDFIGIVIVLQLFKILIFNFIFFNHTSDIEVCVVVKFVSSRVCC